MQLDVHIYSTSGHSTLAIWQPYDQHARVSIYPLTTRGFMRCQLQLQMHVSVFLLNFKGSYTSRNLLKQLTTVIANGKTLSLAAN